MSTKKKPQKVGAPAKPRGQEMGRGTDRDQNREAMADTPALQRGRRQAANKMSADKSAQQLGGDAVTPSAVSPSLPAAIPTGVKLGETGGEKVFKRRQAQKRKPK